MSDVSVHARPRRRTDGGEATGTKGDERVVGCWAGCRKRSHHPEEPGGRVEKGRTRRCAMSEGGGGEEAEDRRRRQGGREEGTALRSGGREGEASAREREGGQTG